MPWRRYLALPLDEQVRDRHIQCVRQLSDVLKRGIPQRTFNPRKVRTMHVGFFGKAFLRPTLRVPQFPKARGEDLFNFPCRFQPTIIDFL